MTPELGGKTRTLVTGATGLLGKHLVARLDRPRVLSRDPARATRMLGNVEAFAWEVDRDVPPDAMEGVATVFHLAGEPVAAGRWTDARKKKIEESRVLGTRRVVEAIARMPRDARPRVLVSASAVGVYGSRGDEVLTEESMPGSGFLANVCVAWETEARAAEALGVRVVTPRIGVVLAHDGGALAAMMPIFSWGLGGPLGSGRQWVPWIHVSDTLGLLLHAAKTESVRGPMNVCAPDSETNARFSKAIGRAVHRPVFLSVPSPVLRLAVGGMADVVLASQRVLPSVAHRTGYRFRFSDLGEALRAEASARRSMQSVEST